MPEDTPGRQFVQLVTELIALIKDQEHENLSPQQRTEKRTRAYQLADAIGAWFDREKGQE